MILRFLFIFFAVCSFASLPLIAHAGTKDKLQKIESQLTKEQQQAAALEQKAKETSEGLESLRHRLIAVTESLQAKSEEQERLEDKLDEMAQDVEAKNAALKDEKQKFRLLTEALIELSRQPPESLFLQTGLTVDHIHRRILIQAVLPRLREQTDILAHDLAALAEMQARMEDQKRLVIAAQENLEGQQHDLDQLIKARQGLLRRTEAQKSAIAAQLVSLSNEAKDLHQLLDKVSPKHSSRVGPSRGLQAALKPPVAGTVIRSFGDKDNDGITSQGLTYTALSGSPVVAPRGGRVVFAGPFRGYGKILILQHEGGYHSFLAGFGRIDAEMGQDVDAGEPLGVLPVKTGTKPELYFEWRGGNEPVDPTSGIALSKGH